MKSSRRKPKPPKRKPPAVRKRRGVPPPRKRKPAKGPPRKIPKPSKKPPKKQPKPAVRKRRRGVKKPPKKQPKKLPKPTVIDVLAEVEATGASPTDLHWTGVEYYKLIAEITGMTENESYRTLLGYDEPLIEHGFA